LGDLHVGYSLDLLRRHRGLDLGDHGVKLRLRLVSALDGVGVALL
jgi:hypothetical protein